MPLLVLPGRIDIAPLPSFPSRGEILVLESLSLVIFAILLSCVTGCEAIAALACFSGLDFCVG